MTNFTKKFTTAIATGALLAQSAAPVAFAGTTLEISGNGAGSDNNVNVDQTSTTVVSQTNNANIDNDIEAEAETGDNDANFNTGGNVGIQTGNAKVNAHVSNDLNSNYADVENCNCAQDTDVLVSGNGAFSDNRVNVDNTNRVVLNQDNVADVDNDIEAEAETGDNEAGYNTGGDVVISTGNATVNASAETNANTNVASIGSGNGDGGHVSFRVLGNGAGSDNRISATLADTTVLNQDNYAEVDNDIEAEAETGENDANFNVGSGDNGDVVILTGDAKVNAWVDNNVNFNAADVDCGCAYDLTAKIAGNGADAGSGQNSDVDNRITANLAHVQTFVQDNDADLDNDLDEDDGLEADTGDNEASKNTAGPDSDPAVVTGNAVINSGVSNSANTNIIGDVSLPDFDMPEVDFDFDWAAMFAYFSMHHSS